MYFGPKCGRKVAVMKDLVAVKGPKVAVGLGWSGSEGLLGSGNPVQTPNNTSEDQEGPPNTPPLTPLEEVWQEEPLDLPWLEKHPEKLQHSQPSSPAAHQIGPTLLLRCPTLHLDQIRGLQADPAPA